MIARKIRTAAIIPPTGGNGKKNPRSQQGIESAWHQPGYGAHTLQPTRNVRAQHSPYFRRCMRLSLSFPFFPHTAQHDSVSNSTSGVSDRIPSFMTTPRREGEFESGPPREPEERTDTGAGTKSWKSRFPGWETHEGRREARGEHGEDPTHDFRYDTNLNPSAVVPRRLSLVVYVIGAVLGLLLLVGVGLLLFYRFMQPSPRSPAAPEGKLRSTSVTMNSVSTGCRLTGLISRT
jgi:hypothetical protein